ncbi:MAG: molybdenum ABC transporter ATP-binding protein [Candidatus Sulfotelmatobacter sp.]
MAEDKLSNPSLTANIRKSFSSPEREFSLDVNFAAAPGFTILFGPSGSGKTTLLDCVAGLTTPDAGRITVAPDASVRRTKAQERTLFCHPDRSHPFLKGTGSGAEGPAVRPHSVNLSIAQRNVGYVLQELALFPHLTVQQNVEFGLAHLSRSQRKQRASAMLADFRIDHLRHQRPAQISGGERQRVALARSLVTDPCVLLLDEPLAALDAATKGKILDDLRLWNQAHRIPILYVTHSREEVLALGERVLVMEAGRIIAQGTPHEVLSAPRQESVAQLAGFENIFDGTVWLVHEDRGTMTCRVTSCRVTNRRAAGEDSDEVPVKPPTFVLLETPLIRAQAGTLLRVGIRAGDILLAIAKPEGLSARNIIPGRLLSLERRDMIISARVDCGVEMEVLLTLAARDTLQLAPGRDLWLVIKTHSCHLMQR